MSQKFGEQRRAAFIRALAACGNLSLAAARVRVSRSWVTLHRSGDPAFDADCVAAIAAARVAVAEGREAVGALPALGWRTAEGVELTIRAGNGRRAVLSRARAHGWSPAREHEFIAELARHGNVRAACRSVGLSVAAAYAHRKKWPAFLARWDAAVRNAEDLLVEEMLSAALADPGDDFDRPLPRMCMSDAIIHLGMFQARRRTAKRPGFPRVRELGLDKFPAPPLPWDPSH